MTQIICIGSVLWDIVGRTQVSMRVGSDVAGRIRRLPGGVAMNIAMTLRRFDLEPVLLTFVGMDSDGDELIRAAQSMGLNCDYVHRNNDLPTDRYMAIEGQNGLIAAIADAHSLERAGDAILAALGDGRLGSHDAPYTGTVALDGNLTIDLLSNIAANHLFSRANLRIAPASPGKAERLRPLIAHPNAHFYVNLEEAGLICDTEFATASDAAKGLLHYGATRAVITDGPRAAADGSDQGILTATPPDVPANRITGAGDTFMAAHIAAELRGLDRQTALDRAVLAAAEYVSGKDL